MRWWTKSFASFLVCAAFASAGPVDFGLAELNAAMAARNLKWKNKAELSLDAPETFRIEPYSYGGAYISGGDLRGLMYGLLEAAEQIRATGRLAKAQGKPYTSLRGVRIIVDAAAERTSEDAWRTYFQMLARNRFNRAHVVFRQLTAPYRVERLLSQVAADYGVDFTLGLDGTVDTKDLTQALAACPLIRSVAIDTDSASRDAVFAAVRDAGRRIALDFDGVPTVLGAATESGIPLIRPFAAWPPSFEVAAAGADANHALFYFVWGRLGYDPKSKLAKDADVNAYAAAHEIALWVAAAEQASAGGSDYVASAAEAQQNRTDRVASAKITPLEIADRLSAAAGQLGNTEVPDFQLLVRMALDHALQQRASDAGGSYTARPAPPTKWTHLPPASAPSDQPLTLTFRVAQPGALKAVRLHYRTLDPAAVMTSMENPAAAEMTFTVPSPMLTGNWDLMYYFEVVGRDGNGWFEPDPLITTPYSIVHIVAPHSGPN